MDDVDDLADHPLPAGDRRPSAHFGPDRRLALAVLAGAVVFAGLAACTHDAGGRLLYALGVLLCAAIGLADLVVNPRLIVDTDGLRVRTGLGLTWTTLHWSDVHSLRVDRHQRHGLTSVTLEIDDGITLAVLGRHALGRDPGEAAQVIGAFAPQR